MPPENSPSPEIEPSAALDTAWEQTAAAQSLRRMQQNPRVKYIVVNAPADACPNCQELTGTYPKDNLPRLPNPYCASPDPCHAFYSPYLDDIYP